MKDWIKDLNDDKLKYLLKKTKHLEKVPEQLDNKIIHMIRTYRPEAKEKKNIFDLNFFRTPAIAAAFSIIVIFIGLLIAYNFVDFGAKDKYAIVTSQIKGKVIQIRNDIENIIVEEQNIIEGDIIRTPKDATFALNINLSSITLSQKTEVLFENVPENNFKLDLQLNKGKLDIAVDKKERLKLLKVNTEYLSARVAGTIFSVEHKPDSHSSIEVFEGIVEAEYLDKYNKPAKLKLIKNESFKIDRNKNIFHNKAKKENAFSEVTDSKNWNVKKLFTFNNPDDPGKNRILGFVSSKNYLIVQSETGIICFDKNSKLLWQNKYGRTESLYFMSVPLIINDSIYANSSNKKLVLLDLKSGKTILQLNAPGNIVFGISPVINDQFMYLPYTDGIYKLDLSNNNISTDPFIFFYNPTDPIIIDDLIVSSSYVENRIAAFSITSGDEIWTISLNNRSFSPPLYVNDHIITSDNSGSIYKISKKGEMINSTNIGEGITADMAVYKNSLYCLSNEGNIFNIKLSSLSYKKIIKIDNKPAPDDYLFKSITIHKDMIIFGDSIGQIKIYNIEKNVIEKQIKTTKIAISTEPYLFNNAFYLGTKNGQILKLNE